MSTVEDITIADWKAASQIDTFANSDSATNSQAMLIALMEQGIAGGETQDSV